MCENAYLSIKNPKASRALKQALDPWPQIARFTRATLLRYVGNFRSQDLGPPLDQILDPHLGSLDSSATYCDRDRFQTFHCHQCFEKSKWFGQICRPERGW